MNFSNDDGPTLYCLNQGTGEWTLSGQVDSVNDGNGKTHALGCDDGKWVDLGVTGASRVTHPTSVRPVMPLPIAGALVS